VAVEMLANEAIGVEAAKERTLLESRLGGTRKNRVFVFFEIEAPQRAADAWLAEAEEKKKAKVDPSGAVGGKHKKSKGGSSTGALEKKKRKNEGGGTLAKKHSHLIDTVLAPPPAPSPLRGKGGSEDKVEESSGDSAAAPRSPAASIVSIPVRAMPAFSVQFSEPEMESDDDNAPKTYDAAGSATEAEEHAEKMASSSSGEEEEEEAAKAVVAEPPKNYWAQVH